MKAFNLISTIRRSAEVAWTSIRILLMPVILLGWAIDDTMKTLAAAVVFVTAGESRRKQRPAVASRQR